MPTETIRRGVLRWRGVVKMDGKIVASQWFSSGSKEQRKAILWEEEERERILKEQRDALTIRTVCVTPLGWAEKYLDSVKGRCEDKTYKEKKAALLRLLKFAGDIPLDRFNRALAESFLQEQCKKRSGYAANKDRKNLSTAWTWGSDTLREEGFPEIANPFHAVKRFKEKRLLLYVPPEEDFWKVYEIAGTQDKVMLLAYLHTAARRSELFRLTWADVDFKGSKIKLTTKKTRDGSEKGLWIPVNDQLRSSLLKWWQERPFKQSEYVFTMLEDAFAPNSEPGQPFKQRRHILKRLCERAGVKPFTWRAIRPMSAMMVYKEGTVYEAQRLLRHEKATTTDGYLQKYGYEDKELRRAVEVFKDRGPARVLPLSRKGSAA